jgi:hypothetical protein
MMKMSAAEDQCNMGRHQDLTLPQQVAVLNRGDRRVLTLNDFTAGDVAALEVTRAPDAAKGFDSELTG